MGVVDRPIRRLPSHLHSPKLKEIPKVLPQVTSFQFTPFPSGWPWPLSLYNDCKRGEADGPVKGNQTSPVPGRLARLADRAQSQEEAQYTLRQW